MHIEKHQKPVWPWPLTFKFNRVLEVVKVHVRAKFHQAKCSGSWVINSALDFGQLWTLIVNISGTDQEINERKTALSSTIFPRSMTTTRWTLVHLRKKWPWPLTLKFNSVLNVNVYAKFHRAKCSSSWLIIMSTEKNLRQKQHSPSLWRGL